MTILDYLKLFRDTPVPSILVAGGIIFLLLSVLQRAGTSIETRPGREGFAIFMGVVLLLSGIGLYLVPPTQVTVIAQQPTPQISTPTAELTATNTSLPPTPTESSTPTATPTQIPIKGWLEEIGQIPESGTKFSKDLAAGQLMFLDGGQLRINGKYCGSDPKQNCVVIYEATTAQTVTVDALIPRNNYVGITDTFNAEEALNDKLPLFWIPPNCIDGCKKATVLYFRDGKFIRSETLTP
jgi:hypothetical protein